MRRSAGIPRQRTMTVFSLAGNVAGATCVDGPRLCSGAIDPAPRFDDPEAVFSYRENFALHGE